MPKVFISYARDKSYGQNLATETQRQLESAGHMVFRDVTGLSPGDRWDEKIEDELESSDLVVLIVSETTRKSEWVHNEISLAKELGIPIIPVLSEKARLPIWVRHIQKLDFSENCEWEELLGALAIQCEGVIELGSSSTTKMAEQDFSSEYIPAKLGDIKLRKPPHNEFKLLDTTSKAARTVNVEVKRKKTILRKSDASEKMLDERLVTKRMEALSKELVAEREVRRKILLGRHSKPAWTEDIGEDQHGLYLDLQINQVTQRFRCIEAGTFLMGSPDSELGRLENEDCHQVVLSEPYWLADTACTQALWQTVMEGNPAHFKNSAHNPVETVSWVDIQQFIEMFNRRFIGLEVRLPTEAQWEYACRAGTTSPFSFGDMITTEQANYSGNSPNKSGSKGVFRKRTIKVKSFEANPWGLYEMHGNVWEFCQDSYQASLGRKNCIDPVIHKGKKEYVLRGGSWYNVDRYCRSAIRDRIDAINRSSQAGFRLSIVI